MTFEQFVQYQDMLNDPTNFIAGDIKIVGETGKVGKSLLKTILPSNTRTTKNPKEIFKRLKEYHGIDPKLASERLHQIKKSAGKGPADDVLFDMTGNVYDPTTREWLGSLTEGGKKTVR